MKPEVDARELQSKVKQLYRDVATNPRGSFHFELGRALAQRLGYSASDLDWVPAEALASFAGVGHFFHFLDGYIEETGLEPDTADCVISNGVINLAPDKARVFDEAARLLRPGGRLAIADIVTDLELPESIVCNADLWAACIGGAVQLDRYLETIERAGFAVRELQENCEYRFLSDGAQAATRRFGVKSVPILAVKSG